MRRADAEAKAMAIGNIADVLRLKTVSPLQKNVCAVRREKTAMYCPRSGDCSKQIYFCAKSVIKNEKI